MHWTSYLLWPLAFVHGLMTGTDLGSGWPLVVGLGCAAVVCGTTALAWVGRGTYDAKEWKEALKEARAQHNQRTAEYLTGLPLLGDYLEEGLAAFGENCEGFDIGRM